MHAELVAEVEDEDDFPRRRRGGGGRSSGGRFRKPAGIDRKPIRK